jgi:hypothetical protein
MPLGAGQRPRRPRGERAAHGLPVDEVGRVHDREAVAGREGPEVVAVAQDHRVAKSPAWTGFAHPGGGAGGAGGSGSGGGGGGGGGATAAVATGGGGATSRGGGTITGAGGVVTVVGREATTRRPRRATVLTV